MKSNIKIAIGNIKILYSISFVIILALVRQIVHIEEILPALDVNMALLSIVFCGDGYYQEIQEKRWEVFLMLPADKRYKTVLQRVGIQFGYLLILTALAFGLFMFQEPQHLTEVKIVSIYIWIVINCLLSIIFFGTLSFTLVNMFQNIWIGIGVSFLIWQVFNSTISRFIPLWMNIYPYDVQNLSGLTGELMKGKLLYVGAAVLLLISNRLFINQNRKGA